MFKSCSWYSLLIEAKGHCDKKTAFHYQYSMLLRQRFTYENHSNTCTPLDRWEHLPQQNKDGYVKWLNCRTIVDNNSFSFSFHQSNILYFNESVSVIIWSHVSVLILEDSLYYQRFANATVLEVFMLNVGWCTLKTLVSNSCIHHRKCIVFQILLLCLFMSVSLDPRIHVFSKSEWLHSQGMVSSFC